MRYQRITDASRALRESPYYRLFLTCGEPFISIAKWMIDNDATPDQALKHYVSECIISHPELPTLMARRDQLLTDLEGVNALLSHLRSR